MNKNLSIVVRLKDQITSPLQKIQKKAKELEKSVTKKKKVNVDTSQATKNLNKTTQAAKKTKKEINSIKSKPVTLTAKDRTTGVISRVKGKLRGIRRVPAIAINAKDKMTSVLGGLRGKILSLKTLATGIVVTAVAKFAFENAIKPGSELISQEVSMTHFLGGNKKSAQNYIKELRAEAKKTTFSSSEVISAGSRAIGITNGDTKQAMDLVKLSEDMSSLKPGKTISDAMEALADALHKKISHIGRLFLVLCMEVSPIL